MFTAATAAIMVTMATMATMATWCDRKSSLGYLPPAPEANRPWQPGGRGPHRRPAANDKQGGGLHVTKKTNENNQQTQSLIHN